MAQSQDVLRVGIPPSMIGQEGDTPLVVEIPRNTPPDQVRDLALAQARAQQPQTRRLGLTGGGENFAGAELPADAVGQSLADFLRATPEIAGLIAQFVPQLRGLKGLSSVATNMAVPAATELGRQFLSGEDLSATEAAGHGTVALLPKAVGSIGKAMAKGGRGLIRKSVNLKGGPFAYDEVSEADIPERLLRERAQMTMPGVAKMEETARDTANPWTADAASALKKARYDMDNAPVAGGGGIMAAARDLFNPRRQLAVGEALAEPFGGRVKGENLAEGSEAILRIVTALIASMRGDRSQSSFGEPPADPNRPGAGPRRRSQQ